MSPFSSPDTLGVLRRERAAVQRECLALCQAIWYAALQTPGAVPGLLASLQQLYDTRTGLDLLVASYDPQSGL